eukprot:TRINITY_DN2438_c2_g1_i1.p1 TRINITY_DN2438_c2_g1~~TRINITY_DN2438_c2_g1_i1.p1  ORF type:complete len:122 (+),score=61.01 TRINITY_DN2438_c2_g1_i1:53-367(+)
MSGAWNAWKNLSRGSRFAIGASWIAVGAAGTYYQDTIEKRTLKFMGAGPAEKVDTTSASAPVLTGGDCDCKPLWDCMQRGGECALLRTELDACLAAQRAAGPRA